MLIFVSYDYRGLLCVGHIGVDAILSYTVTPPVLPQP
jgi:hypothetical protein